MSGAPSVPDPPGVHGVRAYEALRSSSAAYVVDRDFVAVTGDDAVSYLQGQCSQDLSSLSVGTSVESLLLSPQGKIDGYLRISAVGEGRLVVDTEAGFGLQVVARLERFRLRTKVVFEPLDWWCMAVRGPDAAAALRRPQVGGAEVAGPQVVVPVDWPGLVGLDLMGPTPTGGLTDWVVPETPVSDPATWEAARIEAGVPRYGREVTESSIAAEVGLVDRTVSFTKGCFTGQELVARLDARGSNVARKLCGVVLARSPGTDPEPTEYLVGATVHTADGEHEVGTITSAAWSPGLEAVVALATLRRRVVPPASVVVRTGEGDHRLDLTAEARPLPLTGQS